MFRLLLYVRAKKRLQPLYDDFTNGADPPDVGEMKGRSQRVSSGLGFGGISEHIRRDLFLIPLLCRSQ